MVFIGSVLSHRANKEFAHYTAAKHGVLGLIRAFALELAPHMAPGQLGRSDRGQHRHGHEPGLSRPARRACRHHARGGARGHYLRWNTLPVPWIEPVDVANAALFLASDEARYITGVGLPVDLGAMLK